MKRRVLHGFHVQIRLRVWFFVLDFQLVTLVISWSILWFVPVPSTIIVLSTAQGRRYVFSLTNYWSKQNSEKLRAPSARRRGAKMTDFPHKQTSAETLATLSDEIWQYIRLFYISSNWFILFCEKQSCKLANHRDELIPMLLTFMFAIRVGCGVPRMCK